MAAPVVFKPTIEGFLEFVRSQGITVPMLPDNSLYLQLSYYSALELVYLPLASVSPANYTLAVYNLGMSNLVEWAPDQTGQTVFKDLRTQYLLNAFVSGVIQSSSDEGTSKSMVVQEAAKNFTLADLQYLKTPWGRTYLQIVQRAGTLWGLS